MRTLIIFVLALLTTGIVGCDGTYNGGVLGTVRVSSSGYGGNINQQAANYFESRCSDVYAQNCITREGERARHYSYTIKDFELGVERRVFCRQIGNRHQCD